MERRPVSLERLILVLFPTLLRRGQSVRHWPIWLRFRHNASLKLQNFTALNLRINAAESFKLLTLSGTAPLLSMEDPGLLVSIPNS
jgi:hypothetical protein